MTSMQKKRIRKEYQLSAKSPSMVWGLIGEASGLQKWIADYVDVDNENSFVFTWGEEWTEHHSITFCVLDKKKNEYIRFRADDEECPEAYMEMRIEKSELTGSLTLVVTDYAEPDETEALEDIWDNNIERLHRISGI